MTIRIPALGGTDWTNGEVLYAEDLNDTTDELLKRTAPIGSVTAWLKSYTNTPALPNGWVECNGQTLSDTDSVFNGQIIPDLNGAVDTGLKGRFLRGHNTSGITEDSANLEHTHTVQKRANSGNDASQILGAPQASGTIINVTSSSSGGDESRPYNYSVVWIMRVK